MFLSKKIYRIQKRTKGAIDADAIDTDVTEGQKTGNIEWEKTSVV